MSTRDEYIQKLKAQLDDWNAELAKWEAKSKGVQAEMLRGHEEQLESLKRQRDQAIEKLRQVQSSAGDAWMELARGADEAWAKMREAFEKASSHFQK